jgi:GMP synthase (glutamine-hydrolysing)
LTTEPSEGIDPIEQIEITADPTHPKTVVVLDFGSQYSQLITRRVREAGVYSELVPFDASWGQVEQLEPGGILLSGGAASLYE